MKTKRGRVGGETSKTRLDDTRYNVERHERHRAVNAGSRMKAFGRLVVTRLRGENPAEFLPNAFLQRIDGCRLA